MHAMMPAAPGDPGTQVGRYRLLGAIGHGGMATVCLASAPGPLGVHKLLVLKQLRRGQEDEHELVTMFLDEARIAVRLAHPNVVQTYEVDVDDGLPFIAMEYLEGQPLHRVLRRYGEHGGLARDTQLWILTELLAGLHHAHELRDYGGSPLCVVHRDVNPQNVFVTYHGEIKLVDFGIAKAMDSVARTDVGMFKGKLAYMAPEQVHGRVDVDRRVDVFAVGVMMWEAITGRRMWHGRSDLEIATSLARAQLPSLPPGTDIPSGLRTICARALAYDPALRHPDAEAMGEELMGWLREHGRLPDRTSFGRELEALFAPERARRAELIQRYLNPMDPRRVVDVPGPHQAADDDPCGADEETLRVTAPISAGWSQPALESEPTQRHPELPAPTERPPAATEPRPEGFESRSRPTTRAVASRSPWAVAGLAVGAATLSVMVLWSPSSRPRAGTSEAPEPIPALADAPPASRCARGSEPSVLTGDLERDATLTCDRVYLLTHDTRVRPGVQLTIEAGTTILGDAATKGTLVVEPGARLVAEGRPDAPIVFTSTKPPSERRPGDWGGVLLLGRAPINLHDRAGRPLRGQVEGLARHERFGGDDPEDDSGVLRYVRIEYSGIELAPNNEINGLTLAGVGRGTRIDHVQVRHAADDCFELFGGTVNAEYLLCDDPGDDGFDWDLGYQGHVRFLVVRGFERAHHGLEGDSEPRGSHAEPRSRPHLSNVTLCGLGGGDGHGLLLRRGTHVRMERALVLGYDAAIDVQDRETSFEIVDTVLAGAKGLVGVHEPGGDEDGALANDDPRVIEAALLQPAWRNATQRPGLPACAGDDADGLRPPSPLASPGPATAEPGAGYLGAFRDADDRWDEGWAEWTPHR